MFRYEDHDTIREIVDSVGEVSGRGSVQASESKTSAPISTSSVWTAPSYASVVLAAGSIAQHSNVGPPSVVRHPSVVRQASVLPPSHSASQ